MQEERVITARPGIDTKRDGHEGGKLVSKTRPARKDRKKAPPLSSIPLPTVDDLDGSTIDLEMRSLISRLSTASPLFAKIKLAVEADGTKFLLYDEHNSETPAIVHKVMGTGRVAAVTVSGRHEVYFNLPTIKAGAAGAGICAERMLLQSLTDEGVHILIPVNYLCYSPAEAEKQFTKMRRSSRFPIASELMLHRVLIAEFVAAAATKIISRQLDKSGFRLKKGALGRGEMGLLAMRDAVAFEVLQRIYSVDATCPCKIRELTPGAALAVFRLVAYLKSGKLEKQAEFLLSRLQLLSRSA